MSGQSGSLNDHPGYTITKKLLSVEDGLASHEVFCGVQDKAGFQPGFGFRVNLVTQHHRRQDFYFIVKLMVMVVER